MSGEKNLEILLKKMKPKLNAGEFVFCEVKNLEEISLKDILMSFREEESVTIIIEKKIAEDLGLYYSFVASWITLTSV